MGAGAREVAKVSSAAKCRVRFLHWAWRGQSRARTGDRLRLRGAAGHGLKVADEVLAYAYSVGLIGYSACGPTICALDFGSAPLRFAHTSIGSHAPDDLPHRQALSHCSSLSPSTFSPPQRASTSRKKTAPSAPERGTRHAGGPAESGGNARPTTRRQIGAR